MLLVTLSESAATLEGAIKGILGFEATLFVDIEMCKQIHLGIKLSSCISQALY